MKLLLDTHVWIWALDQPEKIGRHARRFLNDSKHEVYLSPVSIWEASYLARRGRRHFKPTFLEWAETALTRAAFREAPFNFAVASAAARIELPQSDIGDVFLAATAVAFDLTLVTSDSQLLACSWLKTLSAD
jgi:PIN domain nuclease of toxin-antitoxin system